LGEDAVPNAAGNVHQLLGLRASIWSTFANSSDTSNTSVTTDPCSDSGTSHAFASSAEAQESYLLLEQLGRRQYLWPVHWAGREM
jgi:hypothetical protein